MTGSAWRRMLLGPGAGLDHMVPGSTLVVMSSIPVRTARAHARAAATRNVGYLDAPVSGGEKGAAEGTLAILVGGEEAVVDRVRPVLEIAGAAGGIHRSGEVARYDSLYVMG